MTHRITKAQREIVKAKFDGRCAYCGEPLGDRWHVDHIEPCGRLKTWDRSKKRFVDTGRFGNPAAHRLENLFPACAPCNIDKSAFGLEGWRSKLSRSCEVLQRNQSTYRFARKYGLIVETGKPVVFHFERVGEGQS